MNRLGRIALSAGALGAASGAAAFGETLVYQSVDQTGVGAHNGFTQQNGNNAAYYGDDVHLGTACPQVAQVYIDFGFFTYDAALYTPTLQVDLFAVDSNGIPVDSNTNDTLSYTPIATAFNASTTFTGHNYNNTGGSDIQTSRQTVCFDFTGQTGAANLTDFAFGYRDINPAGLVSPGFGFSVFTSSQGPILGSSNNGILIASPNDLSNTTFGTTTTVNGGQAGNATSMVASITCIPEPASVGLLGLGSLLGLRRRRA